MNAKLNTHQLIADNENSTIVIGIEFILDGTYPADSALGVLRKSISGQIRLMPDVVLTNSNYFSNFPLVKTAEAVKVSQGQTTIKVLVMLDVEKDLDEALLEFVKGITNFAVTKKCGGWRQIGLGLANSAVKGAKEEWEPLAGAECEVFDDDEWRDTVIVGMDPDTGYPVFTVTPDDISDHRYDSGKGFKFMPRRTMEEKLKGLLITVDWIDPDDQVCKKLVPSIMLLINEYYTRR